MRIVHVIIACFYKEGFGYQENILPAKHKELGYDVHIVTHLPGKYKAKDYVNADNIPVHILPDSRGIANWPILKTLLYSTDGLLLKLNELEPDIVFIHGLQATDNLVVLKYKKKHPATRLFADQHGDYYNMKMNDFKNFIAQRLIYKYVAKRIEKNAEMIWGVTPWRVKFIRDVYGLSKEKTDLLVMGGDENRIDWNNRETIRETIREKYNIPKDAFLLVSGGKIDKAKNIHLLIDAVKKMQDVYLLLFGRIEDDMKKTLPVETDRIKWAGWIPSEQAYNLFLTSDLAVFPGTHSVLWEQSCACGLPGVFKDWQGGFSHVNVGGNCIFVENPSVDNLKDTIDKIYKDSTVFSDMKEVAETKARDTFAYINIAKKSILQ